MAAPGFSMATLLMLAESREPEDPNRRQRLRYYSLVLGAELGRSSAYAGQVNAKFLDYLYRSVPLHDIGKIGVPDSILLKTGPLSPAEDELMKAHTKIGASLLEQVAHGCPGGQFLCMASALAAFHHEWFDGAGYPAGIAGQAIPLPARILAVAEAYDRVTVHHGDAPERVEETLRAGADAQFDPVVVEACSASMAELASTKKQLSEGWPVVAGAASFLA
jgi:putative two-component system response regulator